MTLTVAEALNPDKPTPISQDNNGINTCIMWSDYIGGTSGGSRGAPPARPLPFSLTISFHYWVTHPPHACTVASLCHDLMSSEAFVCAQRNTIVCNTMLDLDGWMGASPVPHILDPPLGTSWLSYMKDTIYAKYS